MAYAIPFFMQKENKTEKNRYISMTIQSTSDLPVITVKLNARISPANNLNAYIQNKDTRTSVVVESGNISYSTQQAIVTLEDDDFIADINEDTALSIVFYIQSGGSTHENSVPVYRDLITFRDSLDIDSDYTESTDDTEYIYG